MNMQIKSRPAKMKPDFFQAKFSELEQLFADLQFGFWCYQDLSFIHVNGELATLDGVPIATCRRSIEDLNPQIAHALGPILTRVMEDDRPFFEQGVIIPGAVTGLPTQGSTWQVRGGPLKLMTAMAVAEVV